VRRRAAKSSDYFHLAIKPPGIGKNHLFHGLKWVNITTAEMFHFLRILLRISMEERDDGGYRAYFWTEDKMLHTEHGQNKVSQKISGTKSWAWRFMGMRRFQQIRAAFQPENKAARLGGDKCYQLRSALNDLSTASRRTFVPGGNLAFDEGGVACPDRQYNKDKPDKYWVDFFILTDSTSYAILHIDVYQGKNKANINIDQRAASLPTTMKVVINAVNHTHLENDIDEGYCCISMDRRKE
jgi:hypothetical protein